MNLCTNCIKWSLAYFVDQIQGICLETTSTNFRTCAAHFKLLVYHMIWIYQINFINYSTTKVINHAKNRNLWNFYQFLKFLERNFSLFKILLRQQIKRWALTQMNEMIAYDDSGDWSLWRRNDLFLWNEANTKLICNSTRSKRMHAWNLSITTDNQL